MRCFTFLLLTCLLLAGCSGGSVGIGNGRRTPVTDYFLAGREISFAGGTSVDTATQSFARTIAGNRGYFMGLYFRGGRFDTEWHLIRSGRVDSTVFQTGDFDPDDDSDFEHFLATGDLTVTGDVVTVELPIATAGTSLAAYSDVELRGTFDLSAAQALIEDVREPSFANNESADSLTANWTLTGTRDGAPVEVEFSQELRGYSQLHYENL
jgi:hypothetical protein